MRFKMNLKFLGYTASGNLLMVDNASRYKILEIGSDDVKGLLTVDKVYEVDIKDDVCLGIEESESSF